MSSTRNSRNDPAYEQNWKTFESEGQVISKLMAEEIGKEGSDLTEVEDGVYELGEYLIEIQNSNQDFGPKRVSVEYRGDVGPEWDRAQNILPEVKDETSADSVMKKQEIIHLHGLIAQAHNELEDSASDYDPDMRSYAEVNALPTYIHMDKWAHTAATLSLAEAVAEEIGGIPDHEKDEAWEIERERLEEENGWVAGHRI